MVLRLGQIRYTGTYQTYTAPVNGKNTLEVWGAQGASWSGASGTYSGGKGAYVTGIVNLSASMSKTLYVYVGQAGTYDGTDAFNGGGHVHVASPIHAAAENKSCGGGGGTDVSLQNGTWSSDTHLYSRIIVAGGGGGALYWTKEGGFQHGGAGGGWDGGNGAGDDPGIGGKVNGPGSTSTAYPVVQPSFGKGGTRDYDHDHGTVFGYEPSGGGGGGWYGGGAGSVAARDGSGAGGSSYAWTTSLTYSSQPFSYYYPNSSYKPSTNYYLTNVSAAAGNNAGNGKACITCTPYD